MRWHWKYVLLILIWFIKELFKFSNIFWFESKSFLKSLIIKLLYACSLIEISRSWSMDSNNIVFVIFSFILGIFKKNRGSTLSRSSNDFILDIAIFFERLFICYLFETFNLRLILTAWIMFFKPISPNSKFNFLLAINKLFYSSIFFEVQLIIFI